MTDSVERFLDEQRSFLKMVDEILDAWNEDGCYKVPTLILKIASQLNWNAETLRSNDPIVRAYLKKHPKWYVTRGAHGGIMARSEHDKKTAFKLAKEKAKLELQAALLAKETVKVSEVLVDESQVFPPETS